MSTKYFTEDHEWILIDGDKARIGITDHAQDALGDIVFVDLPAIGQETTQGEEAAVVESVKAAGEVKAPASGEVTAVNDALSDDPSLINRDAEGEAWIYEITLSDKSELEKLMDAEAYQAFLQQ